MDYITNKDDFSEFAVEAAKAILHKMPWDYDPVGDVAKVAGIITEQYILAAIRSENR